MAAEEKKITDYTYREAFHYMCGYMQSSIATDTPLDAKMMMQGVYEFFGVSPLYPEKFDIKVKRSKPELNNQ